MICYFCKNDFFCVSTCWWNLIAKLIEKLAGALISLKSGKLKERKRSEKRKKN
jgi:hypothetical protein